MRLLSVFARTKSKCFQEDQTRFVEQVKDFHREISVSTIPNYYRATKLFCEMNDIVFGWKKICSGMERVRKALMIELLLWKRYNV